MQPFLKGKVQLNTSDEVFNWTLLLESTSFSCPEIWSVWHWHNRWKRLPHLSEAITKVFFKVQFLSDPLGMSRSLFLLSQWFIMWCAFSMLLSNTSSVNQKHVLSEINFVRELLTRSGIQLIVSRLHYACFDIIYLIVFIFDTINN